MREEPCWHTFNYTFLQQNACELGAVESSEQEEKFLLLKLGSFEEVGDELGRDPNGTF
jgi:hypothetical protein